MIKKKTNFSYDLYGKSDSITEFLNRKPLVKRKDNIMVFLKQFEDFLDEVETKIEEMDVDRWSKRLRILSETIKEEQNGIHG